MKLNCALCARFDRGGNFVRPETGAGDIEVNVWTFSAAGIHFRENNPRFLVQRTL